MRKRFRLAFIAVTLKQRTRMLGVPGEMGTMFNLPTTRLALCWPSVEDAVWPSGIVDAAILVILIEDVLEARIA